MLTDILAMAIPVVIAVVVIVIIACSCYTVAPTDRVLVITGPGGRRFVIGKSALIVPFVMRRDWLNLGVIQVKLQTEQSIPTRDALLIDVGAVANVQIRTKSYVDKDGVEHNPLEIAARNYLNQDKTKMMTDVSEVLLGKMREAIGSTDIRHLMQNRDEFNATIANAAYDDMLALGLELVTFNVQDFSDQQGVIADHGAGETMSIEPRAVVNLLGHIADHDHLNARIRIDDMLHDARETAIHVLILINDDDIVLRHRQIVLVVPFDAIHTGRRKAFILMQLPCYKRMVIRHRAALAFNLCLCVQFQQFIVRQIQNTHGLRQLHAQRLNGRRLTRTDACIHKDVSPLLHVINEQLLLIGQVFIFQH